MAQWLGSARRRLSGLDLDPLRSRVTCTAPMVERATGLHKGQTAPSPALSMPVYGPFVSGTVVGPDTGTRERTKNSTPWPVSRVIAAFTVVGGADAP